MGRTLTAASVSLDGYIAGPNETGFQHLFAWYNAGEIDFPSTHPEISFRLTATDHRYLQGCVDGVGALVVGRRSFDLTDGWGGPTRSTDLWLSSPTASPSNGCTPTPTRRSLS